MRHFTKKKCVYRFTIWSSSRLFHNTFGVPSHLYSKYSFHSKSFNRLIYGSYKFRFMRVIQKRCLFPVFLFCTQICDSVVTLYFKHSEHFVDTFLFVECADATADTESSFCTSVKLIVGATNHVLMNRSQTFQCVRKMKEIATQTTLRVLFD